MSCILSNFTGLTKIDLNGCQQITDAGVLFFAKKAKALEVVRIDRCQYVSEVSLLVLIKVQGARLKVLSIRGCRRVPDVVIKEFFICRPKQLQELNISDCTRLTDACMECLSTVPSYYGNRVATAYHHLTKIDVSGCASFTSLVCCWIAASCPFLQSFKASRCIGFCDKGALALASLVHLEELDLAGCSQITGPGMERMFLSDGVTKTAASAAKDELSPAVVKKIKSLTIAGCPSQGERSVLAIVRSCAKSLVQLDLSNVAPLPATVLVKLVKNCRATRELHFRGQPAVTRAVLAHLASCNKHLRLLDLRECVNVDDLALYPLLVMQSLEELYLSGCGAITNRGLQSLPDNLTRLDLQNRGLDDLDDEGCRTIASRLRKLEKLDLSLCSGVTASGVSEVLQKCEFVYQINVFRCSQINANQLNRLLDALPKNKYGLDVINDPEMRFLGISSEDVDAAVKTRRRETLLAAETRRHQAATAIQIHYLSRSCAHRNRKLQEDCEWEEFCSAVDIQRMFRGYRCRKTYVFVQERVTRAVVYLQYIWRKRLLARRVRRAVGYWTNRVVLKVFLLWKQYHLALQVESERQRAASRASKALHFWGEKTLGRIFVSWREFARAKRIRAKKAIGFWKCQSMPRVLEAWRMYKDVEKRRRLRLTHVFLNAVELESHNSSTQLEKSVSARACLFISCACV